MENIRFWTRSKICFDNNVSFDSQLSYEYDVYSYHNYIVSYVEGNGRIRNILEDSLVKFSVSYYWVNG